MKKLIVSMFLIVCILFVSTCGSFAAAPAAQNQITTVLVDGNVLKLDPAPQIINNQVYFPLGSALTVMGVTANNKTVIVGKANADITVLKGSSKFYAKTNSKSVTINGKPVQLKVPVVAQKNVLYIPGELVYKFTGKKVIYSSKLKTVSVIDEKVLKNISAYFQAVEQTKITDYKYKITASVNADAGVMGKSETAVTSEGEIDVANEINHSVTVTDVSAMGQSQKITTELYLVKGKVFMKDPVSGQWVTLPQTVDSNSDMFDNLSNIIKKEKSDISYKEVIYSSFKLVPVKNSKQVKLQGNMFLKSVLKESLKQLDVSSLTITLTIDSETNLTIGYEVNMLATVETQGIKVRTNTITKATMYDYNKGLTIELPEGVK